MARVTIEDCLKHVENRFDLVIKASQRAHALELGGDAMVTLDNDKPTVLALREIAAGYDVTRVKAKVAEEKKASESTDGLTSTQADDPTPAAPTEEDTLL